MSSAWCGGHLGRSCDGIRKPGLIYFIPETPAFLLFSFDKWSACVCVCGVISSNIFVCMSYGSNKDEYAGVRLPKWGFREDLFICWSANCYSG